MQNKAIKLFLGSVIMMSTVGAMANSAIKCDTNAQIIQYTMEHSTWDQPPVVPTPTAESVFSRTTTDSTCSYKIDYTIPYIDQKDHYADVTMALQFPGTAGKWLCHLSDVKSNDEVYRCDIAYWYHH